MSEKVPTPILTDRDAIRSRILGQKLGKKVITLDDGLEVEVRQVAVGAMIDSIGEEDLKKRMVRQLIMSCFIPGTEKPIFEDTDFEIVMQMPAGGYYRKLIDTVNEFMAPSVQIDTAKKLSGGETPTTSST